MNDLEVIENNTLVLTQQEQEQAKNKAVEYLESMGNTLPTLQKKQFIEMAAAFGLNPFKREIYAVGYKDKWNVITGYEVYLKRAERIGKLDGWKVTAEGSGENMTATVTIYRKDWKRPFEHTVLFSEVCQKTKDYNTGKERLNSVWEKMPHFMCKKVAIAQAFRLCFPDEMGGMPYTSDEMPEIERNVTPEETPKTEPQEQKKKIVPQKKYTQEQMQKIAEVVTARFENGADIFEEDEKATFRKMLTEGKGDEAYTKALAILKERTATPTDAEIESELQA